MFSVGPALLCPVVVSGGGPSSVAWNPSDKSGSLVLSDSNMTATRNSDATAYAALRADTGKSSGKWYWEISIISDTGAILLGVANASASLSAYIGIDSNGWSYVDATGQKFTAGAGSAFGSGFATGDIIGVALDMGAGYIWFSKNNAWQASGNPSAGASPAFASIAGTIFPAASMNTAGASIAARFNAAAQTYSPPSGFTPIGG